MASVGYTVDLITQAQNPICWICSCAMVKGWGTQRSVGVGDLLGGGIDPSNASISNSAADWNACVNLMTGWGFNMQSVASLSQSGSMQASDVLQAMTQLGPAVLLHRCAGFPYGPQWAAPPPGSAHAVVLTSIDASNNILTFNNPWGDLNQSAGTGPVLLIMNNDSSTYQSILGFWPQPANPTPTSQTT